MPCERYGSSCSKVALFNWWVGTNQKFARLALQLFRIIHTLKLGVFNQMKFMLLTGPTYCSHSQLKKYRVFTGTKNIVFGLGTGTHLKC